jgi:hypothetical protein
MDSSHLELGYKDWSAVVDALGLGIQTVMVRSYKPRYSPFLLYPTFTYFGSVGAVLKFQERYREMATLSAIETVKLAKEDFFVEIKYFAALDEAIQVSKDNWEALEPFFIWTHKHILEYVNKPPGKAPGFLWIVRTYKLPKVIRFGRLSQGGSPAEYRHLERVSIAGSTPVLADNEFRAVKQKIIRALG